MNSSVEQRWAYGAIDSVGCMVEFESLTGFGGYCIRWEHLANAWLASRMNMEGVEHLTLDPRRGMGAVFYGLDELMVTLNPWLEEEFAGNVLDRTLATATVRTLLATAAQTYRLDPSPRYFNIVDTASVEDYFYHADPDRTVTVKALRFTDAENNVNKS